MGAITGTKVIGSELAGQYKILIITAPIASASDTITLTLATHGITAITAVLSAELYGGQDADCQAVFATASGLVVTVVSQNAAGGNATDFTGTLVRVVLLGY